MNIDKYRITVDDPEYIWIPGKCPICGEKVKEREYMESIIGWGEDSNMNFKGRVNNGVYPVIFFECPKCFSKSYLHIHGDHTSQWKESAMRQITDLFYQVEYLIEKNEIKDRWKKS